MANDDVDVIIEQWGAQRSDVDTSGMAVIARISRLERTIAARLEEVFARHGIESWEFDLLATLRRHGEPFELTPGQLLASMMISTGAVTNRIDRIEQRGLVARSKHPTDRRQVLVRLTPKGRKLVDAALADHAANEAALVSALSASQQRQLIGLLRTLAASLS